MRGVADASVAAIALWAVLILTGVLAGTLLSRWNSGERTGAARWEGLLLTAAAAGTIAWFAHVGALIGNSASNALLAAHVPIAAAVGFRLAVLWATLPGASMTVGVALLIWATLAGTPRSGDRVRLVAALCTMALFAIGAALWFTPAPNVTATRIPPFVQSAPAALAPLLGVATLVVLAGTAATRLAGAAPAPSTLVAAWFLATLAVAAEQMARSQLGIGPRDAVLLGGASSGLLLWLATGALLHRRIQSALFRVRREPSPGTRQANMGAVAAHLGAALLAISFAAHALAARTTVSLPPGGSAGVTDSFRRTWHLANQGVSRFDADAVDITSLAVEVRDPAGRARLLTPERREHHGRNGEHLDNAIAIRRSAGAGLQAIRILLVDADSLDVASVRVTFLPLPILWPAGIALLVLAALAMLFRAPSESSWK